MFKAISAFFIFIWILPASLLAQESVDSLKRYENDLIELFDKMVQETDFDKKGEANHIFAKHFANVLNMDGAFDYPFDSLVNIGKQKSDDNLLRIFTWNLPQPRGYQKYFGFVMLKTPNSVKVITLADSRSKFQEPHLEQGSPSKWFGALYYKIIVQEFAGSTYYTLLGVDLNNIFSSKRLVEVLYVDNGELVFGKPIIRFRNQLLSRVIFEYSSRATMVLRWDENYNMIICSHLIPMQPNFAGNYQYYVPDLSYDGFKFNQGYWDYMPDIDVRNPLREKPPRPVVAPKENVDPGFLYRSGREPEQP